MNLTPYKETFASSFSSVHGIMFGATPKRLPLEMFLVILRHCTWEALWMFTLTSRTHRGLAIEEIQRRTKDIGNIQVSIMNAVWDNRPYFLACLLNHVEGLTVGVLDNFEVHFQVASYRGRTECLKILLGLPGVTLEHVCAQDNFAFRLAAHYGHTECLQILLGFPGVTIERVGVRFLDSMIRDAAQRHANECQQILLDFITTRAAATARPPAVMPLLQRVRQDMFVDP
jgi:hypothetical protein